MCCDVVLVLFVFCVLCFTVRESGAWSVAAASQFGEIDFSVLLQVTRRCLVCYIFYYGVCANVAVCGVANLVTGVFDREVLVGGNGVNLSVVPLAVLVLDEQILVGWTFTTWIQQSIYEFMGSNRSRIIC